MCPASCSRHATRTRSGREFQPRLTDTTVAVSEGEIAGFVMVVHAEIEQVYVARPHRGTGVADVLVAEAERLIGDAGHTRRVARRRCRNRARRFYERRGWSDHGLFDYQAASDRGPIPVPSHRYVKELQPRVLEPPAQR